MAYAKKEGKPVLDFTGWAGVNWRRIEQNVRNDPAILSLLKNDGCFVSWL